MERCVSVSLSAVLGAVVSGWFDCVELPLPHISIRGYARSGPGSILRHIWNNAEIPEYWNEALLKILPKSGDKADPSNCRGIQMLEVFYKILGNILKKRDRKISEKLDHESQCGFRIERGTIDGVWNIRMTIDKRREHGCETWLL